MTLRIIVMGLAFVLMWSSAFATARIIVANAPPLFSLSLRFALSGATALLIAHYMGQSLKIVGGWRSAQARAILLFGICQNVLYLGLNFIAMQWIEASLAAIIASSMPLIVALLGWIVYKERNSPLALFGLALGLAGVALIMGSRISGGTAPLGIALCIIGALALAVATLSMRKAAGGNKSLAEILVVVGMQMLVGAIVLSLSSVAFETHAINWSPSFIAALLYQTFIPGLAATVIWFQLVAKAGMVRAASFHFLNPFFGVLIAAILLGETLFLTDILGVATIMAGILLVQRNTHKA